MQRETDGCSYTSEQLSQIADRRCRERPRGRIWSAFEAIHYPPEVLARPDRCCAFCGEVYLRPIPPHRDVDRLPDTCSDICSRSLREGLAPAVVPGRAETAVTA